jgi:hypothetical protein
MSPLMSGEASGHALPYSMLESCAHHLPGRGERGGGAHGEGGGEGREEGGMRGDI